MTADLVTFLRARLDEDERAAVDTLTPAANIGRFRGKPVQRWQVTLNGRGLIDADGGRSRARDVYPAEAQHVARHDPARVLAEVDAKRRIIDECEGAVNHDSRGMLSMADSILSLLALPYRDHPDYRPEWAPDA
ncbi:hypothetical protein KV557_09985 [Kitasatospora aureofaciens]|uniref:DUF6221 family protein n=1 Tax=Kitasatospora aureofaciens TaxID=1894 RepID=UPI001C486AB9|nr:DUF6221 family protein [Kitasatospora aureofaciens]MBV6697453.1 hypothetical protein [Kitasatospora aureofaciens]